MDIDFSWIFLLLPLAFALGWLASRLDLRQLRLENRLAPKAYFKGLNYLLNEQQDKAIDAFIEAVQNDPDTSELHFALGNLFRRRGDYDRAVRVHEHLLSRGDLKQADHQRAQHALALDFLKAGLLDRAEAALKKLHGTPFQRDADLALLAIYERSRDWQAATQITQALEDSGVGDFRSRQAHYLCEMAASMQKDRRTAEAQALLAQAIGIAPSHGRAYLDLAQLRVKENQAEPAWQQLVLAAEACPAVVPLVATELARLSQLSGKEASTKQLLIDHYENHPSLDVLEAIVSLAKHEQQTQSSVPDPRHWYVRHLERHPSLVVAARWIAGEKLEHDQFHPLVQRALDHAVKPLSRYRCAACGFEARQHFWQCPGCQTWDSYPTRRVEEI